MRSKKPPNIVHELAYCTTCKRQTDQDTYFDLEERKHFVCCTCGSVVHKQKRPK